MLLIIPTILFSIPQAGKLELRVEAEELRVEAEERVAREAAAQLRLLYHSSSSSASRSVSFNHCCNT